MLLINRRYISIEKMMLLAIVISLPIILASCSSKASKKLYFRGKYPFVSEINVNENGIIEDL